MGPLGRFNGAAVHFFFSLAALSCKAYVASGASIAQEHIRTDPNAATGASITVEAGDSLLARHEENTDVASEGGQRVVIGSDGSLDAGVGDAMLVRQKTLNLDMEELNEGEVEDVSAGIREHARSGIEAAADVLRTRDGNDVILVVLLFFLAWGLISTAVLVFWWMKNSPNQPDWLKRLAPQPQREAPSAAEPVGDDRQPAGDDRQAQST